MTVRSPVPGCSTLYRTPESSFVIGLSIRSCSIFLSPISRHVSMSVHFARDGDGKRISVFRSDLLDMSLLER